MDKLLSPKTVTAMLGVHADTLRRWDRLGILCPVRTIGGHRRWRESDVESMLHNRKDLFKVKGRLEGLVDEWLKEGHAVLLCRNGEGDDVPLVIRREILADPIAYEMAWRQLWPKVRLLPQRAN